MYLVNFIEILRKLHDKFILIELYQFYHDLLVTAQYLKKLHTRFEGLNNIYHMLETSQTSNLSHAVKEQMI